MQTQDLDSKGAWLWEAWFDGACEPSNPGPKAIGGVLVSPSGRTFEISRLTGHGTNIEAEYEALLAVLDLALLKRAPFLTVRGDSKLVINQVLGQWQVKADNLRFLHRKACTLLSRFGAPRLVWVPREENTYADALSKKAYRPRGEELSEPRRIAASKVRIERIDMGLFKAFGSKGAEYFVDLRQGTCTCPDHQYRRCKCKHIFAAELEIAS